jgi:hypothetical protein
MEFWKRRSVALCSAADLALGFTLFLSRSWPAFAMWIAKELLGLALIAGWLNVLDDPEARAPEPPEAIKPPALDAYKPSRLRWASGEFWCPGLQRTVSDCGLPCVGAVCLRCSEPCESCGGTPAGTHLEGCPRR